MRCCGVVFDGEHCRREINTKVVALLDALKAAPVASVAAVSMPSAFVVAAPTTRQERTSFASRHNYKADGRTRTYPIMCQR